MVTWVIKRMTGKINFLLVVKVANENTLTLMHSSEGDYTLSYQQSAWATGASHAAGVGEPRCRAGGSWPACCLTFAFSRRVRNLDFYRKATDF